MGGLGVVVPLNSFLKKFMLQFLSVTEQDLVLVEELIGLSSSVPRNDTKSQAERNSL